MVAAVAHDHPVLLRGARLATNASGAQPVILKRMDQQFVAAVLHELSARDRLPTLLATTAKERDGDGLLKLFHPVQRAFHVALFEIVCDRPGEPRFDPLRIESAGMVVRRVTRGAPQHVTHQGSLEGWRRDGETLQGWVGFATRDEMDLDPDPARRPAPGAMHEELDRRLLLWQGKARQLAEDVTPLFPTPPAVARALGKTILYGVIPVASMELSEVSATEQFRPDWLHERLSPYLKATHARWAVPRISKALVAASLDDEPTRAMLAPYVGMLQQLALELDAFGESADSRALFNALNAIRLPYDRSQYPFAYGGTRPAGAALRQQAEVLVHRNPRPDRRSGEPWPEWPAVDLPSAWPAISDASGRAIAAAAKAVLDRRIATQMANEPRYGDPSRAYRLRAFARVRHHDQCPTRTVWSDYSEPFRISPWFDGAGAPPVPIMLPDPLSMRGKPAPSAAFMVPKSIANLLNENDPKKLAKGEGARGALGGVDWICTMSIPVITLVAFIVLSIFLGLLNLIFMWALWPIKLCIPIPKGPAVPPAPSPTAAS